MSDYVIQKGVPIPGVQRRREGRFPLADMEVGDLLAVERADVKPLMAAMNYLCYRKNGSTGWKFTRRTTEGGGLMVWCTARPKSAVPALAPKDAGLPAVSAAPPMPKIPPPRAPEAENPEAGNPVAAKLRQISKQTKPSVHRHGPR